MICSFTRGCSINSLAVRFPKAVTRANFSRRVQRASFNLAVRGSICAFEVDAEGGVEDLDGEKDERSVDDGSMR